LLKKIIENEEISKYIICVLKSKDKRIEFSIRSYQTLRSNAIHILVMAKIGHKKNQQS